MKHWIYWLHEVGAHYRRRADAIIEIRARAAEKHRQAAMLLDIAAQQEAQAEHDATGLWSADEIAQAKKTATERYGAPSHPIPSYDELAELLLQAEAALPDAWAAVKCDTPRELVERISEANRKIRVAKRVSE